MRVLVDYFLTFRRAHAIASLQRERVAIPGPLFSFGDNFLD
jgi:hypothetical protein